MPPRPAATSQPSGQARYYSGQAAGAQLAAVIAAAELAILAAVASYVWAVLTGALLASIAARRLRSVILAIIAATEPQIRQVLAATTAAARADVQKVILADLGPLARLLPMVPAGNTGRLAASLRAALLRAADDATAAFRDIARAPDPAAAQLLLDELAARGLTGLVTRDGRRLDLTSWAQMAASTALERMHLDLQVRAMTDAGLDVIYVARDAASPPCPKCAPFVRRLLSLSGRSLGLPGVVATLAQARRAGLFHPNCRDSAVPWAGETPREPSAAWVAAQQQRYRADHATAARARALRQARRQHAAAMTRLARARAARLVRHLEGQ